MSENYDPYQVVGAMQKYGGSFVKALADCWWRADSINEKRLQEAFSDYFEQYQRNFVDNPEKKTKGVRKRG